jgi:2'-5' RNA ligase
MTIDAVSHFKRAHLAWLGSTAWPAELIHLYDMLRGEVMRAGFHLDDQPFNPHITLVRKCAYYPAPAPVVPIDWHVESFVLVDSRQTPSGPLYRVLKYWPLETKAITPPTGP